MQNFPLIKSEIYTQQSHSKIFFSKWSPAKWEVGGNMWDSQYLVAAISCCWCCCCRYGEAALLESCDNSNKASNIIQILYMHIYGIPGGTTINSIFKINKSNKKQQ